MFRKIILARASFVTKEGYQLAGGTRLGFNTRPGVQYVANGRRPFGPYMQSFGGQPLPDKNTDQGTGKFWCRIPEGQNMATSVVWNPSSEALVIRIKVNDLAEVSKTIEAGKHVAIETPLNSSNVNMTYTGDRRLVILETVFSEKDSGFKKESISKSSGPDAMKSAAVSGFSGRSKFE